MEQITSKAKLTLITDKGNSKSYISTPESIFAACSYLFKNHQLTTQIFSERDWVFENEERVIDNQAEDSNDLINISLTITGLA